MSDSFIQLPDDSTNTGKKVRTQQVTVGLNNVEQHYNVVADEAGDAAEVMDTTPTGTEKGLVVRIGGAIAALTAGLTDTQLRATPVPIIGAVTTGGLTDTQLRATPVPVSGTVTVTGPLTDTQLRATPVPVSGPLTDTQLRATAVPMSATQLPAALVGARLDVNSGAWLGSTTPTVGQKAAAASIPVVLPTDASGGNQAAAIFVRPRKLTVYRAGFRLAARPYALSNVFGAAGRKQYATIYHTAAATKLVKIRRILVVAISTTVAVQAMWDLMRLTAAVTPATGNPAVTPIPMDPSDPAAEAVTLCLPTTAGTETGIPLGMQQFPMGITGAVPTTNPPPPSAFIDLLNFSDNLDDECKPPTMRAGVAEGYAVTLDVTAAATVTGLVVVEFSEE